jgi:hypothetical protein
MFSKGRVALEIFLGGLGATVTQAQTTVCPGTGLSTTFAPFETLVGAEAGSFAGCEDADADLVPDVFEMSASPSCVGQTGAVVDVGGVLTPVQFLAYAAFEGRNSSDFLGCWDTDLDQVPDDEDNCPHVPGQISLYGCGPSPFATFVTQWNVDASYLTLELPFTDKGNYTACTTTWSDGSAPNQPCSATANTHTFAAPGLYTLTISGSLFGFSMSYTNQTDRDALVDIVQWGGAHGPLHLEYTLNLANPNYNSNNFADCPNLQVSASDSPNLSQTTRLGGMFRRSQLVNPDLSAWDVSNVDSFVVFAQNTTAFQGIGMSNWDVSNGRVFFGMFEATAAFVEDVTGWTPYSAQLLIGMFAGASAVIGTDPSRDFSHWNSCTLISVSGMCRPFVNTSSDTCVPPALPSEQYSCVCAELPCFSPAPVLLAPDRFVTKWNVVSSHLTITLPFTDKGVYSSNCTTTWNDWSPPQPCSPTINTHTFAAPGLYTLTISGSDISGFSMLYTSQADRDALVDIVQLGGGSGPLRLDYPLGSPTYSSNNFADCPNLQVSATDSPNLSQTTHLSRTFRRSHLVNPDLSAWDVSNVDSFVAFAQDTTAFQGIGMSNWDVSNARSFFGMFELAAAFVEDVTGWTPYSATILNDMFAGASAVIGTDPSRDFSHWNGCALISVSGMCRPFFNTTSDTCVPPVTPVDPQTCVYAPALITALDIVPFVIPLGTTVTAFVTLGTVASDTLYNPDTVFEMDWGDNTLAQQVVAGDNVAPFTYNVTHVYTTPGVFTVVATPIDPVAQLPGSPVSFEFVVVYENTKKFVTGGGQFYSPTGALTADPTAVGKAQFGFISKYKKGVTVPTGKTTFRFEAGDGLKFQSTSYEWLVVAGATAKFKGDGKLNGVSGYKFIVAATDGDLVSGSAAGVDKFRIKITNSNAGNGLVYDNNVCGNSEDDADPLVVLTGGKIQIH